MAYSNEELLLLASLPQMIGAAAASVSPSGFLGTGWELITSAKSQMEGVSSFPSNSLIRQLQSGPADDRAEEIEWDNKVQHWVSSRIEAKQIDSADKLRELIVEDARTASALLAAKASPAEAREYKEWALAVGEKVAEAWVEGAILGFGGEPVTYAERSLIDEVRSAFDLAMDGPDQRSTNADLGSTHVARSTNAVVVGESSGAGGPLSGCKVIITAGPSHEAVASDHYIAKHDTGDQGYMFAEAAVALGAETILVSGPVNLALPPGAQVMPAETALQMLKLCEHELPCDIVICAAQVSQWCRAKPIEERDADDKAVGTLEVKLIATPDILATLATRADKRPTLVIGCMAEGDNVIKKARRKLTATGCDLIVVQDLSPAAESLISDKNAVHLISPDHVETWPLLGKHEIASRLLEELAVQLATRTK